jgi:hypothetical protein
MCVLAKSESRYFPAYVSCESFWKSKKFKKLSHVLKIRQKQIPIDYLLYSVYIICTLNKPKSIQFLPLYVFFQNDKMSLIRFGGVAVIIKTNSG